jgi:hypothetical protein
MAYDVWFKRATLLPSVRDRLAVWCVRDVKTGPGKVQ